MMQSLPKEKNAKSAKKEGSALAIFTRLLLVLPGLSNAFPLSIRFLHNAPVSR